MPETQSNKLLDLFNLRDRVAVVTGGAGLLGAEFARTLAKAGAAVVVADQDIEAASNIAESIRGEGGQCLAVHTDVTASDSVRTLVATTLQAFSRLDILVNSAALDPKFDPQTLASGQSAPGSFENYPLEAWNQALAVNLTGMFLCCQAVVLPMLAQGKGVIVNLCSIYGLAGPDQRMYQRQGQPAQYKPVYYSVTKAGVLGLTRYLATYYAGRNIRVNALSPGGVYNGHDSEFVQAYSARAVLGRMAEKDEMNGALLFLASDASSYMTGANLVVDGGWTAW
ncbi:MAG TPA: SDR family oxidoreductase [Anaerolineales bacterium]|nr:SDR family oxidoreductase [Anaerolineales bacterium]